MSTSRSDATLRIAALASVSATMMCALAFHIVQNRFALTGGSIALSKSIWLGLAVLFWLILPSIILFDARITPGLKRPFMLLLLLMGARGLAELWMLYYFKNWSPAYGIAHNIACVTVLWVCGVRLLRGRSARHDATAGKWLLAHCFVTGALFLPESYYAWYMQSRFITHGSNPIYFVPDDGNHGVILGVTSTVDVLLSVYLVIFLYSWLHEEAPRARS